MTFVICTSRKTGIFITVSRLFVSIKTGDKNTPLDRRHHYKAPNLRVCGEPERAACYSVLTDGHDKPTRTSDTILQKPRWRKSV